MKYSDVVAIASDWQERTVRLSGLSRAVLFSCLPLSFEDKTDESDAALANVYYELMNESDSVVLTYATILETRSVGTACGGSTGDQTWRQRALDLITNDDIGVTLEAGKIVVPSGRYVVWCSMPYVVSNVTGRWVKGAIRNNSGGKYALSPNHYANVASVGFTVSFSGSFNLPAETQVHLAYMSNDSRATNGLGAATNVQNELYEFYSTVTLLRLGN